MRIVSSWFVSVFALGGLAAVGAASASAETVTDGEARRVLAAMPDVVSAKPTGLQAAAAPPYGPYGPYPGPYGPPYAAPYGPPCGPAPCGPPCGPAPCGPPPCPDPCANPCWEPCPRFTFWIGAWAWGMDGRVGDDGNEFDVDADWTDSLENDFEVALDARARVEFGRWSGTLIFDGGHVENDVEDDGFDFESEMDVWIVQGQIGFGLFGGTLGCSPCAPVGCLEIYAGVRTYWVHNDVDVVPGSTVGAFDHSEDEWADAIVGLRGELHVDRWSFILEGDVGGGGSDLSWHLLGAVEFHFTRNFGIAAGWKVLDVDYENDDFVWDVTLSGPFLALTFSI